MEFTAKKQDWLRILLYIGITFLLTWGYCLLILYPVIKGESLNGVPSITSQLLTAVVMFFPALGVLITRLLTKEGFRESWLMPNLRGSIKTYLLAWFGPSILTILGALLYFLIFPDQFDPDCGYMQATLDSMGATAEDIPAVFYRHYPAYKNKQLNVSELARVCDLSRTTVYKYIGLLEG